MSAEALQVQIAKRAWGDSTFKATLLSNPKQAIKEAFGIDFPAGIELKVVEETPSLLYLSLPPKPEEVGDGKANPNFVW